MRGGDKNKCEKTKQLSFRATRDGEIELVETEVSISLF